ncbi:MAG: M6 family metalloprotease domain-containing protein [bacterium]|jgi:immune inhibitor A
MRSATIAIVLALVAAAAASAMPVRPDLLERLIREGRVEDAGEALMLGSAELERRSAKALPGSIKVLVLLVDFADVEADTLSHSRRAYHDLLFSSEEEWSMRNYYDWSSYGNLDVSGEVYGWFILPEMHSYYSNNRKGMGPYPRNAQKMVEDAVDAADETVDFSRFDNDGPDGIPSSGDDDGVVDYLFVIHAGQGYEWTLNPDHIHSHVANIPAREVDGVLVKAYATEPEDGRVGTYAHEMGHLLGLPDLYDATLSSFGLGAWSLMSYGSWGGNGSRPAGLDAWSKIQLGFVDPVEVDTNMEGFRLPCIEDGPHALRLWSEGAGGPQYFVVENRRAKSWDASLDYYGEGLLLYHVDERILNNSGGVDHLVTLEQADGRFDLEAIRSFGFGSDEGDPYPGSTGNRNFSWWTLPANYSNEGNPTQVSLKNISDPADTMTLDIEVWSPIVLFERYDVNDQTGDNDGEPDPGEAITLDLEFKNHGTTARDLVVRLKTDDEFVQPSEMQLMVDSLPAMSVSDPLAFDIQIGDSILEPYEVTFTIDIEADYSQGRYSYTEELYVAVPLRRLEHWPQFLGGSVSASVAAADIDLDGVKEIAVGSFDGNLHVWELDGTYLPGWPVQTPTGLGPKPAICDVDIDGQPDIIVCSLDGLVYVFSNDGTLHPGWPQATGDRIYSPPALADIDDDGMVEIISGSMDGLVYAWNEDGELLPNWPVELGGAEVWMAPAVADLDGDHIAEVLIGGFGDRLYAIKGDGTYLDGWPILLGGGCGRGSPCVADFDGDGIYEIAVSGLFSNSVYLVGLDGKIRKGWPKWSYNCSELSAPIPADVDNDGLPEVSVSTSCGTIVAWNADGSYCDAVLSDANNPVIRCEPVYADVDGNGSIEGLVGTSVEENSALDAFGADGRVLGFPLPVRGNVYSTPVVGDLDDDGFIEIAAATMGGEVNVWRFIGASGKGRVEYSQSRGDEWNTGLYGFTPNANVPLPDLALSSSDITVWPDKPRVGDVVKIGVKVTNVGHWDPGQFSVNVYYYELEQSRLISSIVIPGLGAKEDTVLTVDWEVPDGSSNWLIYVSLDHDNEVREMSELNNLANHRLYMSVADLAVRVSEVDPYPVSLGDTAIVSVEVENLGQDVAHGFSVSLYDSLIAEERRFAGFTVDSLVPEEAVTLQAPFVIDEFRDDFVMIYAVVDKEERVLEYYLSNNTDPFQINSGVAGEVFSRPLGVEISDLDISRSSVAMASPQCNCIFVSAFDDPEHLVFQSPGSDIDLARNKIVFSQGGDIVAYDLSDSLLSIVSTAPEDEAQPAISGENIAWVGNSGGVSSLYLERSSAEIDTLRMLSGALVSNPEMSHLALVWEETAGENTDILAYDLETDSLVVVFAGEGDQANPSVWGSVIVWEDRSRDGGDIAGLDLETGERLTIARRDGLQLNPSVSGDIVIWQDNRNGNWDLYAYSLSSGEEYPISRQKDDQVMPALTDSTVLWVDHRLDLDVVRGLKFGVKRTVAEVERFEALSQDGQISLLLNVREFDNGIRYRFYRYPDDRPLPPDRQTHLRTEIELGGDSTYVFADTLVAARRPFFYTLGIVDGYGDETLFGPVNGTAYQEAPRAIALGYPAPNPCRNYSTMVFGLPRTSGQSPSESWPDPAEDMSRVDVAVYSVTGQLVRTLRAENLVPGYYQITWDGRNNYGAQVSSGVYVVRAAAGGHSAHRKVILVK